MPLEELIALVKALDPIPKREAWPQRMVTYSLSSRRAYAPSAGKTCLPSMTTRPTWITWCLGYRVATMPRRTFACFMRTATYARAVHAVRMMSFGIYNPAC
jgi:hypothetical protein